MGVRSSAGEIVEVEGGHIVRSTGRKDRHSKVCTATGPRDRRVRLSAHTAIQFYDVQDRLGFDRPSKAVDWLIKKAKAAIDELAELPAWNPTIAFNEGEVRDTNEEDHQPVLLASSKRAFSRMLEHDGNERQRLSFGCSNANPNGSSSSFLPPFLDSDSIADTIKSFFPMGASNVDNSSAIQFQNQYLRLSLQSFQDPMSLNHHHSHSEQEQFHVQAQAALLEHHQQAAELGRFQRFLSWNSGGDTGSSGGGVTAAAVGGYVFNGTLAGSSLLQPLFGQNQFFSQRGPLQSSFPPSIRTSNADHSQQHQAMLFNYTNPMSGIGFPSNVGGFSSFRIPARIQGHEEEQDGMFNKPSSASSDSHH